MKALKKIYRFYKSQKDGAPLFRVGSDYVALFHDAELVSITLNRPIVMREDVAMLHLPADCILDVVALLHEKGISAYTVSSRNTNGEYDFPDIDIIQEERRMDY